MSKSFDFYYDVVSPYSYLAATQIQSFCARTQSSARYKPFFLGGVMQATGNKPPLMVSVPTKQAWMMRDVMDWASYYGVPMKFPAGGFPFNSMKAQRMLIAAEALGKTPALTDAFYAAIWGRGEAPDESTLVNVAQGIELDGQALLKRTEDQEVKDKLKANTEDAVKLGAFGAPTFVYKDRFFWGNDRMCLLEKMLMEA